MTHNIRSFWTTTLSPSFAIQNNINLIQGCYHHHYHHHHKHLSTMNIHLSSVLSIIILLYPSLIVSQTSSPPISSPSASPSASPSSPPSSSPPSSPPISSASCNINGGIIKNFSYEVSIQVKAPTGRCSRADSDEIARVINDNFDRAFQFNGQTAVVKMESEICAVSPSKRKAARAAAAVRAARVAEKKAARRACARKCVRQDFDGFQNGEFINFINTTDYKMKIETTGGFSPNGKARIQNKRQSFPELGNVLIIQKQGSNINTPPKDNSKGGTISFQFLSSAVRVRTVGLFDIDEDPVGQLQAVLQNGTVRNFIPQKLNDGSKQTVPIHTDGVRELRVVLAGSGAVTHLDFCVDTCSSDDAATPRHRQLYWGKFFFKGSGLCSLCYLDNKDERNRLRHRRLTAEADSYSDSLGHIFTITKDTEDVETVAAQAVNGDIVQLDNTVDFDRIIPALEVNEADFIQDLLFDYFRKKGGHCLYRKYAYVRVTIVATEVFMSVC